MGRVKNGKTERVLPASQKIPAIYYQPCERHEGSANSEKFIFLDVNSCLQKVWKIPVSLEDFPISMQYSKADLSLWDVYLMLYLCVFAS